MNNSNDMLEEKIVETVLNPNTGEFAITGDIKEDNSYDKSFEDMVDIINNGDDSIFSQTDITEKDIKNFFDINDSSMLDDISKDKDLSDEDIRIILEVSNKRMSNKKFNVYKELPESVQEAIANYVNSSPTILSASQKSTMKKVVAETILDDFISNIQANKAKTDFATELHKIYENTIEDLSDASLDMIEDRNKAYREMASKIEDAEKKNKLNSILDQIDEAGSLSELKELAKRCKIKVIELEKPFQRCYNQFMSKYTSSSNNIYDINLARTILARHLKNLDRDPRDADIFLILFTKQVKKYSSDNPLEHAYMYYVLYHCAMLDSNRSKSFMDNILQVVDNYFGR